MSSSSTAVGALYDSMLQSALRQFFERATVDAEPACAIPRDTRLAIDPSANPSALIISWFGTRYTLRVPGRWAFSAHEVRLAQAIGAVLAARYHAIHNPRIIAERGDLFSGAIEDRYVGAFIDHRPYAIEAREARADQIASIIELLRVAALSSFESRPISTGILLLGTTDDQSRMPSRGSSPSYTDLAGIKSAYRLADGVRTVFLANSEGRLLDIVDINRWVRDACRTQPPNINPPSPASAPPSLRSGEASARLPRDVVEAGMACAEAFNPHARATTQHGNVCVVLSPSREIKVFGEGSELFTFRGGSWHLLDVQAKYRLWAEAVGHEALAMRIFQTSLDLADAREGALFVVARDPEVAVAQLVAPPDRLEAAVPVVERAHDGSSSPSRRDLLRLIEGRSITDLDATVFQALASLDGAMMTDRTGRLLAAGAILRHPPLDEFPNSIIEGARTTAAIAASRFGPVLKVSEDGVMTFFDGERVWDI